MEKGRSLQYLILPYIIDVDIIEIMMSKNSDKVSINDSGTLSFHFLPKPPW